MTLILSLANNAYTIQISDRRLSYHSEKPNDEANKATMVRFFNEQFVCGFTGIATFGPFNTQKWLVNSLINYVGTEYNFFTVLESITKKATTEFRSNNLLRRLSPEQRRLSFVFTGYSLATIPMFVSAIVTNCEDIDNNKTDAKAWDEFRYFGDYHTLDRKFSFVSAIGNTSEARVEEFLPLKELLDQEKPSVAVLQKGIELIRDIAARKNSSGTIGRQLSSITIFANPNMHYEAKYHTDIKKDVIYIPSIVLLTNAQSMVMEGLEIRMIGDEGPGLIAFPKVRKNALCPCGSGKKYKNCHGLPSLT